MVTWSGQANILDYLVLSNLINASCYFNVKQSHKHYIQCGTEDHSYMGRGKPGLDLKSAELSFSPADSDIK
jgi:hypothetical protein